MAALMLLACMGGQTPTLDEAEVQLSSFVDDCRHPQNDSLESASGLWPQEGVRIPAQLCENDRDIYALVIPAGTWVGLTLELSGTGEGDTDLDLWEVATGDTPTPLAVVSEDSERDFAVAAYSASEKPYEWLSWYNPEDEPMLKYVVVDGWGDASDHYELVFQVIDSDEVLDCETTDETRESGPCSPSATESPDGPPQVTGLAKNAEAAPPEPPEAPSQKLVEFVNATDEDHGPSGWPPTSISEPRAEATAEESNPEIPIDRQTASFMTKLTQLGLAGISLVLGLVAVEHVQSTSGKRLRRPKSSSSPPRS